MGQFAVGGVVGASQQDTQFDALVSKVKQAQRDGGKDAWLQHCDSEAGGMRDPTRHTAISLRQFLDTIDLPSEAVPSGSSPLGGCAVSAQATDMQLVEKVKKAQRESPHWKDLWRKFCDSDGGGVYDPMRHENGFSQRYLTDNNIQVEVANGRSAVGEIASANARSSGLFIRPGGATPIGAHATAGSSTVEPLVQRVKDAQRSSEEFKKAWHKICDADGHGVRDPARHDAAFLLRFLEDLSGQGVSLKAVDE